MASLNLGHVVGPGIPAGGTSGDVLRKSGATDYVTAWGSDRLIRVTQEVFDAYTADDITALYNAGVMLVDVSGRGLFNIWSTGTASDATANKWSTSALVIRRGTVSIALAANTTNNNAPISYSGFTEAPTVIVNPRTSAPAARNVSVMSATATGATVYADNPYSSAGTLVVDWMAVGK